MAFSLDSELYKATLFTIYRKRKAMKRILLPLLFIAAMALNAQNFDEAQLTGTWTPTETSGTLPYGIRSFASISLGDLAETCEDEYEDWVNRASGVVKSLRHDEESESEDEFVLDYFISNNNKLHIVLESYEYALRFVIEELTATSLKVRTYDGACSICFTKNDMPSAVNAVQAATARKTAGYNLKGQKISRPQPRSVYVRNGEKRLSR